MVYGLTSGLPQQVGAPGTRLVPGDDDPEGLVEEVLQEEDLGLGRRQADRVRQAPFRRKLLAHGQTGLQAGLRAELAEVDGQAVDAEEALDLADGLDRLSQDVRQEAGPQAREEGRTLLGRLTGRVSLAP